MKTLNVDDRYSNEETTKKIINLRNVNNDSSNANTDEDDDWRLKLDKLQDNLEDYPWSKWKRQLLIIKLKDYVRNNDMGDVDYYSEWRLNFYGKENLVNFYLKELEKVGLMSGEDNIEDLDFLLKVL